MPLDSWQGGRAGEQAALLECPVQESIPEQGTDTTHEII